MEDVRPSINDQSYETKFKSTMGQLYTKSLFYEFFDTNREKVLYTLRDIDWEGYPSLYLLYMQEGDILEWNFSRKYFDSWEHWQLVSNCNWMIPYITRWRHELELRTRSEALQWLLKDAKGTSRSASVSNRYLLERGWADKATKGRPSKADVRNAAKELASREKVYMDDFSRIQTSTTELKPH